MFKFEYEISKKLRDVEDYEMEQKPLHNYILKLQINEIPDENILLSYGTVGFIHLKNPDDPAQKMQIVDSYRDTKCNYSAIGEEIEILLESQKQCEDIIMNLIAGFTRYKESSDSNNLEDTEVLSAFIPYFGNIIYNFLNYKTEILSNTRVRIRHIQSNTTASCENNMIIKTVFKLPNGDTERLFENELTIKRFNPYEYIPNVEGQTVVKTESIEI